MVDSALDVYRIMASGSAQINPFSDYFQESEELMKNKKPIFEGKGITRDVHIKVPFSCSDSSDGKDNGCNARFPQDSAEMIKQMEADDIPGPYEDKYDYSKGVFFDYSSSCKYDSFTSKCEPGEDTKKCLERIFECGDMEWDACSKYMDYCDPNKYDGDVCKYNLNNQLIKKFVAPSFSEKEKQIAQSSTTRCSVG